MRLSSLMPLLLCLSLVSSPDDSRAAPGTGRTDLDLILLVTIDGARADLLDHPETVPEWTRLAGAGVRFAGATTSSPMTFPATASLMAGRYPHTVGLTDEFTSPLDAGTETLALRFRQAGWATGGFPGDYLCHGRSGIETGFTEYCVNSPELSDSARVDSLLAFLERREGTRRLAWIGFTLDAANPAWERYLGSQASDSTAYLSRMRLLDAQIGRLRSGIEREGILPRTLFVVMGTRGESVPGWPLRGAPRAESSLPGHGFDLTEDVLRVPWTITSPGQPPKPASVQGWVSTVDLLPTLLDLAGLDPAGAGDGISLLPALDGRAVPSRTLFHEADHSRALRWKPRYAARSGAVKLLLYGMRSTVVPLSPEARATGADALAGLQSAVADEYQLKAGSLDQPDQPDSLFRRENEEMRRLIDVLSAARRRDPGALVPLHSLGEQYPDNAYLMIELAIIDMLARREISAADRLDGLLKVRPELVEVEALYAEHLLFFNRYDILIGRLEGLSGRPMFEADRIWRLAAAELLAGQYEKASADYSLASTICAPPERRWRLFQQRASEIRRLSVEIESHPQQIDAYLALGETLWSLGLYDRAYTNFQQARTRAVTSARPEYLLGHYLALEGRARHAEAAFKRAVEKDSTDVRSRVELAYAQIQQGKDKDGFENLRAAVASGQADAGAHYNLACLLARRGELEAALAALEAAMSKGYRNRSALESDPDLKPLREDPRFSKILARMK